MPTTSTGTHRSLFAMTSRGSKKRVADEVPPGRSGLAAAAARARAPGTSTQRS